MPISIRAALAMGLSLAGLAALAVSTTQGQSDGQVQRADTNAQAGAAQPKGIGNASVASIDMERIIQEYEKYKESSETFKNEAGKKQQELMGLLTEAKTAAEKRDQYKIGTPDYQTYNDRVAELQAQYNAQKDKVTNDFMQKESNAIAAIYNDIRYITEWYAKNNGITFVIQVGKSEAISGDDPNTVMAAMARNVVYYHPSTDITTEILAVLNNYYQKQKAQAGGTGATPAAAPANGGN
ncbi:hypothetical protein BH23PLA1_BH23PLA1_23240 [soil metagenome]